MSNAVIRTIKRTIGKCSKNYLEGKITWASAKPYLEERGGVYGIAIKLDKSEVESFFGDYCDDRKKDLKFKDWKTIGNNYYPLYWGKDIIFALTSLAERNITLLKAKYHALMHIICRKANIVAA